MTNYKRIHKVLQKQRDLVIDKWVNTVIETVNSPRETEEKDCQNLFDLIVDCLTIEPEKLEGSKQYDELLQAILSFTTYRAINEFTPTQTSNYILSLKNVVYELLLIELPNSEPSLLIDFNEFIDRIAVVTFQNFCDSREEVISSQAFALEHDTPIVKITTDILLMPLMGIIDTSRAQKIIEGLLNAVVEHQAAIAILDMTAVPTFDTHVANNILKTIMAAKMVGTHVVVSGISPNAALTIVKLGIDLNHVETFSTLENAMNYAYKRTNLILTPDS